MANPSTHCAECGVPHGDIHLMGCSRFLQNLPPIKPRIPDLTERSHYNATALHDVAHMRLLQEIRQTEYSKRLDQLIEIGSGDIDPTFLGFLGIYYFLSYIIPTDRIVYDVGCAYAIQSWFFRNHKGYVGIDPTPISERLILPNMTHYQGTIQAFLSNHKPQFPHFAICSYVPPWHGDNEDLVRRSFRHLFVYYP